jgi:hypothetical protein
MNLELIDPTNFPEVARAVKLIKNYWQHSTVWWNDTWCAVLSGQFHIRLPNVADATGGLLMLKRISLAVT